MSPLLYDFCLNCQNYMLLMFVVNVNADLPDSLLLKMVLRSMLKQSLSSSVKQSDLLSHQHQPSFYWLALKNRSFEEQLCQASALISIVVCLRDSIWGLSLHLAFLLRGLHSAIK